MRNLTRISLCVLISGAALAPGATAADSEALLRLRATRDVRSLERVDDSLWIGTTGGLFIYDLGNDRFVDATAIESKLPHGTIRVIRAKGDSVLVGTDGGLGIYVGGEVHVLSPENRGGYRGVALERIRAIDVGLGGELFLGTYGLGLGVIGARRSYTITREDSLLDNKVYGTVQQDVTTFYYATSMGLCAWRDSLWVGFQAGAGIPRGEIRQIIPRGGGRYYLLVGGYGVYRFDGHQARRVSKEGVFPEDDISVITVDASGDLWAAGRFGGIAVYQNGRWKPTAGSDPKIWQQSWRSATADDDGAVFFGAASGLVVGIEENRLKRIRVPGELPDGGVRRLVRDGSGRVFFLSGGRVVRMESEATAPRFQSFPGNVADLAVAPGGGVWAAGRWGLFRIEDNGFTEFAVDTEEHDPAFVALCFDDDGRLWVTSRSGEVYRFDGVLWMRVGNAHALGLGSVDRLIPDGGGVWAFGPGGALRKAGRWVSFGAEAFGESAVVDAARAPNGTVIALTPKNIWGYDGVASRWRRVGPTRAQAQRDTATVLSAPEGETFQCAAFDAGGRLFVGTEHRIGVLGEAGWVWISAEEGVDAVDPVAFLVTDESALWVGFARDGLLRLPRKSLW